MRAALALVQEKTAANRSPRHGQRKHAHHSREMETPAVARAHVQPQHPSTAGALGRTAVECTEKQCRENSACICVCVCVCVCVCMCVCACVRDAHALSPSRPLRPHICERDAAAVATHDGTAAGVRILWTRSPERARARSCPVAAMQTHQTLPSSSALSLCCRRHSGAACTHRGTRLVGCR